MVVAVIWDDFNVLAFNAFRYALGRKTYVTAEVSDILIRRQDDLDPHVQDMIAEEIEIAIKRNRAGMPCDVDEWQKLLNVLNGIEDGR